MIWFTGRTKHHNEQIFGDQINCLFFFFFLTKGVSETALHTEVLTKSVQNHTYCTSFDILSAGFHMISA